jgi:hypothetical protein
MAAIMLYTAAPDSEGTLGGLVSLGRRDRLGGLIDQALEAASNGSARHREMLGQALADARLGRFEVMLIWALDRVSREKVEATLAILRRFAAMAPRCGHSRNRGPRRPILGWLSCSRRCTPGWPPESRRRSERTRAGLEHRKREGLPVGRQPGATDKKPRRRSGYMVRWERERAAAG